MRIIPSGEIDPGCCALTRTDIGPFIDTLIDFDTLPPYGRLLLAVSTVEDLGQMIGMAPKDTARRLRDELDASRARVRELEAALEAERSANKALVHAGYRQEDADAVTA